MKKFFIVALAAMGMTACMQDAVVETPHGGAIAFENAFVGNATRAGVMDNTTLDKFQVWGYVNEPSGVVFDGEEVTKENGVWSYLNTQYWVPENHYYFAAVAPAADWTLTMESGNNIPRSIEFTNTGDVDLIYAEADVEAKNENDPVAFQFEHLLSKIKLSFTTNLPQNTTASIDDIKIVTPKKANLNLSDKVWTPVGTEDLTLQPTFVGNNLETADYFIVPAETVVEFDLTLKVNNVEVYAKEKTATLPADAFEMGHAYVLSAEISPEALTFDEIEFTVEGVDTWELAGNPSDDAANLMYHAQIGGTYTLTEDVVLDAPVVVPAGVDFVLNLNSKTIRAAGDAFEVAGGNLTINGDGTVYAATTNGEPYCAVWAHGDAYVRINGGEYKIGYPDGDYNDLIYAKDNAKIDIYGGYFHNSGRDNAFVLNLKDNSNASITVYGGTFKGFNPADNNSEGSNTSFVAEGYAATETETGVWTVAYDAVSTTAELQARINEGQEHITLASGVTFDGTVYMKSNVTIVGLEGSTMHCIHLNGADNVTIKNVIFDAAGATMAYSLRNGGTAIRNANILTGNETVNNKTHCSRNIIIEGCTFQGELKYGAASIAFTDQGRSSGYTGNVTIKGCIFNTNGVGYDIYGYYCGHEDFVIEGNTFKSEFTGGGPIFLGSYASATPIVVKNNNFARVSSLADAMYTTSNSTHTVTTDASGNTFAE